MPLDPNNRNRVHFWDTHAGVVPPHQAAICGQTSRWGDMKFSVLAVNSAGSAPRQSRVTCTDCIARLDERDAPVETHGYDWILAFGRYLGSQDYYIRDQIALAVKEKAPKNAIHPISPPGGHKKEHGWATTDDITNPAARIAMGLDPMTETAT